MININDIKVKIVINIFLICIIMTVGYFFLISPEYRKARQVKSNNLTVPKAIAKQQHQLVQITNARDENNGLHGCYSNEKRKLSRRYNQQQLAKAIINMARFNGVTLMESGEFLVRTADQTLIISCNFLFLGSFEKIVNFIVTLYKSNYFLVIRNFSLTNHSHGNLELKMQLDGYQMRAE